MALDITPRQETDELDISEKGRSREGQMTSMDRRLFMQLLAFGGCATLLPIIDMLQEAEMEAVLYTDLNDPQGIALLTFHEEPDYFIDAVRPLLNRSPFQSLTPKPEYTMFGRTYALGYEENLVDTLLARPRRRVANPEWPWAIWYPLRRSGEFEQLSAEEQRVILMEHGGIGRAFGRADYGYDIRLACHGLDKHDNDFVIGLVGRELYPLSVIVQRMRKTRQTSLYLERLGPFFVGKAVWQNARPVE